MQAAVSNRGRVSRSLAIAMVGAFSLTSLVAASASADGPARASIVNGTPTSIGALPSLAFITNVAPPFIRHTEEESAEECAGTVVAPRVVLTAGHCVQSERGGLLSPANYTVLTGATNRQPPSGGRRSALEGQRSTVSQGLIYPGYKSESGLYDVGLLVLDKPVSAPPIQLAAPSAGAPAARTQLLIAGWGLTSHDPLTESTVLRTGTTTVQSTQYCRRYGAQTGFLPQTELCATDPKHETVNCDGDSGGPGMVRGPDGALVQVGVIISSAEDCSPEWAEFLTRVDVVSAWVSEWIAAIEAGEERPSVKIPEVEVKPMTEEKAQEYVETVLASNFEEQFEDRTGELEVSSCEPVGDAGMTCEVSWPHGGNRFHGHVTVRNAKNREGHFVTSRYKLELLNKRCLRRTHNPKHCRKIYRLG